MKNAYVLMMVLAACGGVTGCSSKDALQNKQAQVETDGMDGQLTKFTNITGTSPKNKLVFDHVERMNLAPLAIDSKYNVQVFVNADKSEPGNVGAAFIAPKLFAYGSQQGGDLAVRKHANGNVTISFNVILVDGKSKLIMDSKSRSYINLPDQYLIQDWAGLRNLLTSQYTSGGTPIKAEKIGTLSGCPKEVTISYAAKEYNVTPSQFLGSDSCDFDPFTVSMTVTRDEAKDILYNQLPKGTLDVAARYESKSSRPVSKVNINFSKKSIYNDLLLSLKTNWFVDIDAKKAVTEIVKNRMMQVSIQGATDDNTNDMVSRISALFFEPFRPDPKSAEAKECTETVCLQFSSTIQNQSDDLTFEYEHDSNDMMAYSYGISTKLKNTSLKSRTLGLDTACKSNCGRIVNDGVPHATGLIVHNGTVISLQPEVLIKHKVKQIVSHEHRDNVSCLQTVLQKYGWSVNQCNSLFHIPSGGTGATVCNACAVAGPNYWTEITNYNNTIEDQVFGSVEIDSLSNLIFTFEGYNKTTQKKDVVKCPIAALKMENSNATLNVTVDNNGACNPFDVLGASVSLSVSNQDMPIFNTVKDGQDIQNWTGAITQVAPGKTFVETEEMQLTVSIFESDPYGLN